MKSRAAFKVISWRNHLESLFPVTQKHLRSPNPVLLILTFPLSADAALRGVGTPKGPHGSLFTHFLGNLLLCYAIRERKNIIYKRNHHKRSVMTWNWHVPEQLPLLQNLVIDKYTLSNFQNLEQNSPVDMGKASKQGCTASLEQSPKAHAEVTPRCSKDISWPSWYYSKALENYALICLNIEKDN